MATIKIRNEKPIETTRENAEKILKSWNTYKEDRKNNQAFTVAGFASTMSQIVSINLNDNPEEKYASSVEAKMERDNQTSKGIESDYREMRKKILALSPKERMKHPVVAGFLKTFFKVVDFTPTEEQRVEIAKRVVKYFEENQRNIYPNTFILKDIVTCREVGAFKMAGLRMLENALRTDYEYANRNIV